MLFSVIICTYNRSNNLPKCIDHLVRQEGVEDLDWEVVVVDNNSTDRTQEVVAKIAAETPLTIRYVQEKQQGLNHARNRGILESKGSFITFIDDDIIVTSAWLSALYTSLVKNHADAVGGRIHFEKSLKLPSWIRPDMYGFLGYKDLGEKPFQMDGVKEYPFGGNMAFNRRVVEKIGLFNPNVGRKGAGKKRSELFKGAETDYLHRLSAAGGRMFYEPDAIVYHQILPFQIKKRYFRTIHYNAGYQKAVNNQAIYGRNFYGVPLFFFPQLFRGIGRYILQLSTKGSDWAFRQQMTVAHFLGMMNGYIYNRRESRDTE